MPYDERRSPGLPGLRMLVAASCVVAIGLALHFLPRSAELTLLAVLLLILGAEFANGWTDAPNAMATVVGTRSLSPRAALLMATVFNLIGVMSGTAVATTIGTGIIDPTAVSLTTVGGAMVGIIIWSSVAARRGIPTSERPCLGRRLGRLGDGFRRSSGVGVGRLEESPPRIGAFLHRRFRRWLVPYDCGLLVVPQGGAT